MELSLLQTILRTVASSLKNPVMVILLIFIAFSAFCIGWIIVEAISERRHLCRSLPALLDQMKHSHKALEQVITDSGLLMRQKEALLELTKHPDFSRLMLESLADNLYEKEQAHYEAILKWTGIVSKLAPMAGLLGTLIPLGPGIIALGKGDTYTLSVSMLTAFDTTIAGLVAAGVCLVIHTIRKHWYTAYMFDFETLLDCTVDMVAEK
ncbi:MAG: MotA/TolQ/ExbB proton channel family protein [Lachnospiraceae bacterium]